MKIESFVTGAWCAGDGRVDHLVNAVNDESIGEVHSLTSGFDDILAYGRDKAGPVLRQMTTHQCVVAHGISPGRLGRVGLCAHCALV